MSLFSFPCGLSTGVTHTTNLKIKNLTISSPQAKVWTKKSTEIVLTSTFVWLPNNLNSPPLLMNLRAKVCGFLQLGANKGKLRLLTCGLAMDR